MFWSMEKHPARESGEQPRWYNKMWAFIWLLFRKVETLNVRKRIWSETTTDHKQELTETQVQTGNKWMNESNTVETTEARE